MAADYPTTKVCSLCKAEKPADDFGKNARASTGLRSRCRECDRADAREWAKANPEKARERERRRVRVNTDQKREQARKWRAENRDKYNEEKRAWKRANPEKVKAGAERYAAANADRPVLTEPKLCSRCGVKKPAVEFYEDRKRAGGLSGFCRDCTRAASARWVIENPNQAKEARKLWYEANREEVSSRRHHHYHANLEEMRARQRLWAQKNPGSKRASDLRWQAANRDKQRLYRIVSQGRRRDAIGADDVPASIIREIGQMQRWRCAVCSKSIRKQFTVDHIIPLAKGGRHNRRNLQLLCGPCNSRKHAKDPLDFMRECGRLL